MRAVLKVMDAICGIGAAVAALAIAGIAVMLIAEVILTSQFGTSQPWVVEYSGYGLAAALFAGSGWAMRTGGHIRVTVLMNLLPGPMLRLADIAGTLAALAMTLYASRALIELASRSAELGSVSTYLSRTPLVYPQAMLAAGFVILAVGLTARLIRLITGEAPEAPPAGASVE